MKEFSQYLALKAEIINQELQKLLDFWNFPEPLNGAIRYILESAGKRIRPILTLISCEAVGGSTDSSISAAIAIELIHNASLLWDDVIKIIRNKLRTFLLIIFPQTPFQTTL